MIKTQGVVVPAVRSRLRRRAERDVRAGLLWRGISTVEARLGLSLLGVVLLVGLVAPLTMRFAPQAQGPAALAPPSTLHWFGTDDLGRDIFSRVVYGIRVELVVSLLGVPIGALVGSTVGLLGTLAEWSDILVQRLFDVLLAFPTVILGLAVVIVVRPGESGIVATIVVANIPVFGRILRGAVVIQRNRDYVISSELAGSSRLKVLFRHLLPNALDPVIVQFALSMATAVFLESGLSFVGIGIQPPAPSLGNILSESIPYMSSLPLFALAPMIPITALVLGFNLIADGLNRGLRR